MSQLTRISHRSRLMTMAMLAIALSSAPSAMAAETPTFVVTRADGGANIHAWPGGPVTERLRGRTPLGSMMWLWVVDRAHAGRWGLVVLPVRPNGSTGWVDLRGRELVRTTTWVIGNLDRRRVTLMRGSRPVRSFQAAIGAPVSPTPTGRFSVTDLVATGNPSGSFGWYAFGLSGHQPNLPPGWNGGDQLAIHGTNDPATIGLAASAGCLRVSARALAKLRRALRPGTPVMLVRDGDAAWRMAGSASVTPRRANRAVSAPPVSPALDLPPIRPVIGSATNSPMALLSVLLAHHRAAGPAMAGASGRKLNHQKVGSKARSSSSAT